LLGGRDGRRLALDENRGKSVRLRVRGMIPAGSSRSRRWAGL
jgi:hypothetical protein